jgi:hypothetical protein
MMNVIDDEVPAHKKKSKKKGQPRADHKHVYETVLLTKFYHGTDFKTGKPSVSEQSLPTKVCIVCGRIDDVDWDESYYAKKEVSSVSFVAFSRELTEKALGLQKWHADFFDKFAIKMEE